jgi:GWxTD domain-containing protein
MARGDEMYQMKRYSRTMQSVIFYIFMTSVVMEIFAVPADLMGEELSNQDVEALYVKGLRTEHRDSIRAIAKRLASAVKYYPAPAVLRTRVGMLYLKARDPHPARLIFRKALEEDSTLIAARVGLGQVYLEMLDNPKRAIRNLEKAIQTDSTYADAHYLLGRVHLRMGHKKEVVASARAALRHDPDHSSAFMLLAQYYIDNGKVDLAMSNFSEFLRRTPEDETAAFEFARGILELGKFDEVYQIATLMDDETGLPLRALAQAGWGDYEDALDTFERYVEGLPQRDRDVYYDISLVGLPEDVIAYQNVAPEDLEQFLRRFWFERDPFKTTGGTMRRVEHYRRVWRGLTLYGDVDWPFDKRGQVYVRYGEPDWKSSYQNVNSNVPIDVQRVQERMAYQLYGEGVGSFTFFGPVYPIKAERTAERSFEQSYTYGDNQPLTAIDELDFGLEFHKPVTAGSDRSTVGWEVWIYTDIENGLEVVFTDEYYTGRYDFAPTPTPSAADVEEFGMQRQGPMRRIMSRLPTLAPGAKMERLSTDLPERYNLAHLQPLEFYYEVLTFRGENGKADVQLNFGLPLSSVVIEGDGDTTVTIERRIALIDEKSVEAQKLRERLGVKVSAGLVTEGQLAMDRVDMLADVGEYRLAMQMGRVGTNLLQAYVQEVVVPDYNSGALILSDLQLATQVRKLKEGEASQFSRGSWFILPSPSRAFNPDTPLFVYFEIYNLKRDNFGNTNYQVGYEVRRGRRKQIQTRAKKKTGESVSVSYEQVGTKETEYDYVELDLMNAKPGRYTVKMVVKDLNTGQETLREGKFQVMKPE